MNFNEWVSHYPQTIPWISLKTLERLLNNRDEQWEQQIPAGHGQDLERDKLLYQLLLAIVQPFLQSPDSVLSGYDRWIQESFALLLGKGYLQKQGDKHYVPVDLTVDPKDLWKQWDQEKILWSQDADKNAQGVLLEECLRALPEILKGERKATDVIFPHSSMKLVEGIYTGNPISDLFNDILANVVVNYIRERLAKDSSSAIKILEIGAGTGGTTGRLLPKLSQFQHNIEEYCYTDLSKAFLMHAQDHYLAKAPYLTTSIFNVEKPIAQQQIKANDYDIVIAANVLHATTSIRETLRNTKAVMLNGGILIVNEISDQSLFTHLTFGLLEGWWLYEDAGLRIPGSPALYPETWQRILAEEGFVSTFFPAKKWHQLGQQIIITQSDGSVRQKQTVSVDVAHEKKNPSTAIEEPLLKKAVLSLNREHVLDKIQQLIMRTVSKFMKLKIEDLDVNAKLSDYGFDSITLSGFVDKLNEKFDLELTPTILFEHPSISSLANYLHETYPALFTEPVAVQRTVPNETIGNSVEKLKGDSRCARPAMVSASDSGTPVSIAIVGMSGCFPEAGDIHQLWENLKEGRHCIQEIPTERWDWRAWDGDPHQEVNKTNIKWGGFIKDIDAFDPLFFGISPREAELMDPNQRLLMTYIWLVLEDAGYSALSLSGSHTGIFVGTGGSGYSSLIANANLPIEGYSATGIVPSIGPNRMSYFLNIHGPSEPIETACSSSLVAIHRAVIAMEAGDCDQAIVGGINTMITPEGHIGFNKAGMLCQDGRCKTFAKGADGYVRGEGVGMLFLKHLEIAKRDGDHIYGLIRGSAENHGGRANSLTAPNPKAQLDLLIRAYRKAGIHPGTVSYIEAHGTGTELGDPIEINSLKAAFQTLNQEMGNPQVQKTHCGLGSVKTNIGHLELAAGIAGIIKVLLQFQHKRLAKSLHCDEINPYIDLKESPFYVVQEAQEWSALKDLNGKPLPRRAGVSSFGFGGVNAHVVLEEYIPEDGQRSLEDFSSLPSSAVIVPLSAKNRERLQDYAKSLVTWIQSDKNCQINLIDLAYTLQVGREAMEVRLGMIIRSMEELEDKLQAFINGAEEIEDLYIGQVKRNKEALAVFTADEDLQNAMQAWASKGKYNKLLDLWVKGLLFDWNQLYGANKPNRISAPTYPFAKERYWVKTQDLPSHLSTNTPSSLNGEKTTKVMCFEEVWQNQELYPLFQTARTEENAYTILCFLSNLEKQQTLVETIKAIDPHIQVIFITEKLDDQGQNYRVVRGEQKSYQRALQSIRQDHIDIDGVFYLWPLEDPYWMQDLSSITSFLQGLLITQLKPRRILLAAEFNDGLERCYLESWIGFERSLELVMPNTQLGVIFQENTQETSRCNIRDWTHKIWKEFTQKQTQSVCYQQNKRHVLQIYPREPQLDEQYLNNLLQGTILITGGFGGLGFLFADYFAKKRQTKKIILTGRSALTSQKQSKIKQLEKFGCSVYYLQADVCDHEAMHKGLKQIRKHVGSISGVIHSAGIKGSKTIVEKDFKEFQKVLDPKVKGTLILDEVLIEEPLHFICYFSSSSAILGDFGACDYAVGNRFEMAYAQHRNALKAQGKRSGKTMVINWPFWKEGGMQFRESEQADFYLKSSGQQHLTTSEGIEVFEKILCQQQTQHLVLVGQPGRVHRFLGLRDDTLRPENLKVSAPLLSNKEERRFEMRGLSVEQCLEWDLTDHASRLLKIPRESVDTTDNLADYGFDSISLAEFASILSDYYGFEVTPALFFGYSTLEKLKSYFLKEHAKHITEFYQETQEKPTVSLPSSEIDQPKRAHIQPVYFVNNRLNSSLEPIAIIGMSGRFPQARSIGEMWEILSAGKDAVEEIPEDRFDWRQYDRGQHYKWSGLIPGIDEFDPLFFEISPRDAEKMDPRQRHLLQESWKALEDAGYGACQIKQHNIGMFVGVEEGGYGFSKEGSITANHNGILAARIAYFLDLHGPTMAINTACSSGLVAAHQAILSLRSGECSTAIAAGVNLMLSPAPYVAMSQAGMLSSDGKCFAFDQRANGMVPGEAVAVVILKKLSDAETDKDPIHAIIRGSGVNYDGKTNGITAPSGVSQTALLKRVYHTHHINPEEIDYIVAHGTGTKLGDPVEVNALNDAFKEYTQKQNYCALTSTKSLFGHTFAASGLVSLISLVEAIKHESIPGSLHCEKENDYIRWKQSPFYVNKSTKTWSKHETNKRIGAVSAFGMSGTNAHMVVENYFYHEKEESKTFPYYLLSLSSKTPEALQEKIQDMLKTLQRIKEDKEGLMAMCYTLQMGRHHFSHRCAIVIEDLEDAVFACNKIKAGEKLPNIFRGKVRRDFSGQKVIEQSITDLLIKSRTIQEDPATYRDMLCALADFYCQGYDIVWDLLYGEAKPHRIPAPTYPFAREHYWIKAQASAVQDLVESTEEPETVDTLMVKPIWREKSLNEEQKLPEYRDYRVYLCGFKHIISQELQNQAPHLFISELSTERKDLAEQFSAAAVQLFEDVQRLLQDKPQGHILLQVIVPSQGPK
ncbi:MAG: SDR family NAD(P)-dependent oxidoreductase, partial [Waddliaceae bacterium]